MDKKSSRIRRAGRTRARIRLLGVPRLCIYKTSRHTYAQVISADGNNVVASASTVSADARKDLGNGGNKAAAEYVGKTIAEKAKASGVEKVAFDRSGYKYHGRVKALADAARESGLDF